MDQTIAIIFDQIYSKRILLVIFACLLGSTWAYHEVQISIQEKQALLEKYDLRYDHISFDFDGIVLHGVSVTKPIHATALSVKLPVIASMLNLATKRITIEGFYARLDIRNFIKPVNSKTSLTASGASIFSQLPSGTAIKANNSKIRIQTDQNFELLVESKTTTWKPREGHLTSRSSFIISEALKFENLELNGLLSKGVIQIVAQDYNEDESANLKIVGKVDLRKKTASLTIKAKDSDRINIDDMLRIPDTASIGSIAAKLRFELNDNKINGNFRIGSPNIILDSPYLAKNIIDGIYLRLGGNLTYDISKDLLTIRKGTLRTKTAVKSGRKRSNIDLRFKVHNAGLNREKIHLSYSLPPTQCEKLKTAIPHQMAPALEKFTLSGNFGIQGSLMINKSKLSEFRHEFYPEFHCQISHADEDLSPEYILSKVRQRPSYQNVKNISPFLIKSIVSFEDGSFWRHKGIILSTIVASLRKNLKKGKIVSGGSTISMQTAKNLFLSGERTIARKIQEVLLTWHLENEFTKSEILDIYLNIIEYGPGIYGIKKAAKVFFDKDPSEISLAESTFIASILPSPVRRFRHFCRGKLTPRYEAYLNKRLDHLAMVKLIPEGERALTDISGIQFAPAVNYPHCQSLANATLDRSNQIQ